MEKKCNGCYPPKEQKPDKEIKKAIIRMLNCRRYLMEEGFEEYFKHNKNINYFYNDIAFHNGDKISKQEFESINKSSEMNSLLERMTKEKFKFVSKYETIGATFCGGDYRFDLVIWDNSYENFFSNKSFLCSYFILLDKQIITDQDLEEFVKYQKGLENVMKQDSLLTYETKNPKSRKYNTEKVKIEPPKTNFTDPWDIDIPKVKQELRW